MRKGSTRSTTTTAKAAGSAPPNAPAERSKWCRKTCRATSELVLFNRFLQPDIDVGTLSIGSGLKLSTSDEVRLPLRWIAILSGRISPSLAATGGVHTAQDAAKLILAGADAVMVASAALERGPSVFRTLTDGLQAWLDVHGYDSVAQVKGTLNQIAVADPAAFERAQYIHALELDHP